MVECDVSFAMVALEVSSTVRFVAAWRGAGDEYATIADVVDVMCIAACEEPCRVCDDDNACHGSAGMTCESDRIGGSVEEAARPAIIVPESTTPVYVRPSVGCQDKRAKVHTSTVAEVYVQSWRSTAVAGDGREVVERRRSGWGRSRYTFQCGSSVRAVDIVWRRAGGRSSAKV